MSRQRRDRGKSETEGDKPRRDESDYTTTGDGRHWYGHPGGLRPQDLDFQRQTEAGNEEPPFKPDDSRPQPVADDEAGDTADYAYGAYGRRKPGHARSDPYPTGPDGPSEDTGNGSSGRDR